MSIEVHGEYKKHGYTPTKYINPHKHACLQCGSAIILVYGVIHKVPPVGERSRANAHSKT